MHTEKRRIAEIANLLYAEYRVPELMDYDHAVGLIQNYFNGEFLSRRGNQTVIDERVITAFEAKLGDFNHYQDNENNFWEPREANTASR